MKLLALPAVFSARHASLYVNDLILVAEAHHLDLQGNLPQASLLLRHGAHSAYPCAAQLFYRHGAVQATVNVIIVGDMQRIVLTEAVVHLHGQGVASPREVLRHAVKGRVCPLMLGQLLPVQTNPCTEARSAKHKAHVPSQRHFLRVYAHAAIIAQSRMRLPYPGYWQQKLFLVQYLRRSKLP